MKKIIPFLCLVLLWVTQFSSCKKSETILFCTGIPNVDGKPEKCGKKFYSGEVTLVIKKNATFGSKEITVIVYELKNNTKIKTETVTVPVNPDKKEAHVDVALLNKGIYQIVALVNNHTFAEGHVTIFD